jgi:hypothetical protein
MYILIQNGATKISSSSIYLNMWQRDQIAVKRILKNNRWWRNIVGWRNKHKNEVKEYLDAHYVCASDSCWRVFGFETHRHYSSVERLPVHLPNKNYITYSAETDMLRMVSNEFLSKTMLTEWFKANQVHPDARDLTYCDFPSKWRWNSQIKA